MKKTLVLSVAISAALATVSHARELSEVNVSVSLVQSSVTKTLKSLDSEKPGLVYANRSSSATSTVTNYQGAKNDTKVTNSQIIAAVLLANNDDSGVSGWKLVATPSVNVDSILTLTPNDPAETLTSPAEITYTVAVKNASTGGSFDIGTVKVSATAFKASSKTSLDKDGQVSSSNASGSATYTAKSITFDPADSLTLAEDEPKPIASAKQLVASAFNGGTFTGSTNLVAWSAGTPAIKDQVTGVPAAGKVTITGSTSGSISFSASKLK